MLNLFFSYSHRDESLRDELEIHLAILKRQGVINAWHDRQITAGSDFVSAISDELEHADIVLLLISPYFLASDYCYEVEMQRAMERHHAGQTRVIPVILHPCDWQLSEFQGLQAVPTDGNAISKFPNQHDAFWEVSKAIRNVAAELGQSSEAQSTPAAVKDVEAVGTTDAVSIIDAPRSSNLRVKRSFTERDIDKFQQETFEYISNFFEQSMSELSRRNPEVECDFRRVDANHFTAIIYIHGKSVSECKIWSGGRGSMFSGICYSSSISSDDNSMNDSMSVNTDGYSLYFHPLGFSRIMTQGLSAENLTQQGAAEYYWTMLMRPVQ